MKAKPRKTRTAKKTTRKASKPKPAPKLTVSIRGPMRPCGDDMTIGVSKAMPLTLANLTKAVEANDKYLHERVNDANLRLNDWANSAASADALASLAADVAALRAITDADRRELRSVTELGVEAMLEGIKERLTALEDYRRDHYKEHTALIMKPQPPAPTMAELCERHGLKRGRDGYYRTTEDGMPRPAPEYLCVTPTEWCYGMGNRQSHLTLADALNKYAPIPTSKPALPVADPDATQAERRAEMEARGLKPRGTAGYVFTRDGEVTSYPCAWIGGDVMDTKANGHRVTSTRTLAEFCKALDKVGLVADPLDAANTRIAELESKLEAARTALGI